MIAAAFTPPWVISPVGLWEKAHFGPGVNFVEICNTYSGASELTLLQYVTVFAAVGAFPLP